MDTGNTISSKYEVDLQAIQRQMCAEEREKRKYVLQQKRNNRGCHHVSTSDSIERIPFSKASSVSTTNVQRRNVYHLPVYVTPNISSNLFYSSTQVKDKTISSKYEVDHQAIQRQMCAEEREKRKYFLQQKRNNRGCHPASTSDSVERIPFSNTSSGSINNVERRDVHHTPFGSTEQLSNFVERTPLSDIINCGISKIELQMSDEMLPDSVVKKIHGISKDYIDHGDAIFVCYKCDAMLWEDEMLRGSKKRNKTSYSLCCSNGDVELPRPPTPPPLLCHLYKSRTSQSRNFMDNIRAYNMMFSFTSLGGKVDKSYQRALHYDSQNEVVNRQKAVSSHIECKTTRNNQLDSTTIEGLKDMLDSYNPLVQSFRMVRDCFQENEFQDVSLKLIGTRDKDERVHNLPTTSEIAALIHGDFDGAFDKRDIVVRKKFGGLQRINELHPSYLALQYPLIFPYATEDGYRVGIKHRGIAIDDEVLRTNLTIREFFFYKIQDRQNQFSLLVNAKKLFQQFLVDGYTMIVSARLNYIRTQQPKLRVQNLKNLDATVESRENNASSCGKPILLPSSFIGGSRYMMQKYLDAMAICKSVGYPDYS
ncbi:uncharacterized protein LOC110870335 [Helianthus annuus]|uniref:uncharacterized protein LOC110870335 n=1 Tax=Helianthus annuus TaxID=4232 RepID=UPI001652C6E0|nr:uncharacterized protein LOC110870335 [Helianthus annuus]